MEDVEMTELARLAAEGDRQALNELWRRNRRWIAVVVLAHKPRSMELDDVLQEVALAVVRSARSIRDPHRLRAWLRSLALNTVRTSLRTHQTQSIISLDSVEPSVNGAESTGERTNASAEHAAHFGSIESMIMGLPPIYRETLLLSGVRGLTTREVAATLDTSVKTIETRLRRARLLVMQTIERHTARSETEAQTATQPIRTMRTRP